jgi:hypothetical protein
MQAVWILKELPETIMKMKVLLSKVFLFLFTALVISCSSSRRSIAIEEGWDMLGEQKVNFVRDVDEIDLSNTNRYTALRFKVEGKDVRLNELKLFLDNGDILQPSLDDVIAADQFSRDISIAAEGRMIDKIQFRYRTTGNVLKGRANVLVFGKRYDPYRY